jgi:hypothetical protein
LQLVADQLDGDRAQIAGHDPLLDPPHELVGHDVAGVPPIRHRGRVQRGELRMALLDRLPVLIAPPVRDETIIRTLDGRHTLGLRAALPGVAGRDAGRVRRPHAGLGSLDGPLGYAHDLGGLGVRHRANWPEVRPGSLPHVGQLGADVRPLLYGQVPTPHVFADDQANLLGLGAVEDLSVRIAAQLAARAVPVPAVEDRAGLIDDDRAALPVLADVLDELAVLGLVHLGQEQAGGMALGLAGHGRRSRHSGQ